MKKIIGYIFEFIRFVTIDIWRITEHDETGRRGIVYYILKTVVLTVQRFFKGRLAVKASALTYYSVFAMIPLLAFIFGIARGFGMDSHIADFLIKEIGTQG
ncbi:MAG: YihY/virulence factor BrkB family protein, partial [Paludibacteraceae bacterium]|nr:YihY/virulence factor BrkB family protein [Paludibacteraceae bacterium]